MKGRFEYGFLTKYPHMSHYDVAIWERFIKRYPDFFDSCDYDVVIGDIIGDTSELDEEWKRNANYLGKYKIDIVAYREENTYIIEVKPKAAAKALGQIIMYDYLYTKEHKPTGPTIATIITDESMPNMEELCAEHNIMLMAV